MNDHKNPRTGTAIDIPEEFAYTQMLEDAKTRLSKNLSALHTKEEAGSLLRLLRQYIAAGRYDAMLDPETKLRRVLSDSLPDFAALLAEDGKKPEEARLFPTFYGDFSRDHILSALRTCETAAERLPTLSQLDVRFFQMLFDCFDRYRSSTDYLSRFVRQRMAEISPELLDTEAPTGVLILRQLIKQFGWGTVLINGAECRIEDRDKGPNQKNTNSYYSPALKKLCEEAFGGDPGNMAAGLTEAQYRSLLKQGKTDCRLALIADQLSAGRFNSQGKTREFLYIFAIAFEMRCTELLTPPDAAEKDEPGREKKQEKDLSDLTRNLFYDFYSDNLVNGRTASEKKEIDGYGINWKNFIEVIYLYYLSDDSDGMTPALRFYKALKGCLYCRKKGESADSLPASETEEKTELFRNRFRNSLMHLPEKEFLDTVARTFECRLSESKRSEMTDRLREELQKTGEQLALVGEDLEAAREELQQTDRVYNERKKEAKDCIPTLRLLKTAVHADVKAAEALFGAFSAPAEEALPETLDSLQKEILRLSVYPTAAQFFSPEEVSAMLPVLTDPQKKDEREKRLEEITLQLKQLTKRGGSFAAPDRTAVRHASQTLCSAKETEDALKKRMDLLKYSADRAKLDRKNKKRAVEHLRDKYDRLKSARRAYEEELQPDLPTSISAVSFASEKRTAAEAYEWLIRHTDPQEESLWLLGIFELSDEPGEGIPYKIGKKPENDDGNTLYVSKEFVQCLNRFTDRYYNSPEETERLNYKQMPVVYRSDLLFAASDYLVTAAKDEETGPLIRSFEEYYQYFCSEALLGDDNGANGLLRRCGYQEINDKSIFDLLVVYLSYKKTLTRAYLPKKKTARRRT